MIPVSKGDNVAALLKFTEAVEGGNRKSSLTAIGSVRAVADPAPFLI